MQRTAGTLNGQGQRGFKKGLHLQQHHGVAWHVLLQRHRLNLQRLLTGGLVRHGALAVRVRLHPRPRARQQQRQRCRCFLASADVFWLLIECKRRIDVHVTNKQCCPYTTPCAYCSIGFVYTLPLFTGDVLYDSRTGIESETSSSDLTGGTFIACSMRLSWLAIISCDTFTHSLVTLVRLQHRERNNLHPTRCTRPLLY